MNNVTFLFQLIDPASNDDDADDGHFILFPVRGGIIERGENDGQVRFKPPLQTGVSSHRVIFERKKENKGK